MVVREFRIISNTDEFLKSEYIVEALLYHCKLYFDRTDVAFAIIEQQPQEKKNEKTA